MMTEIKTKDGGKKKIVWWLATLLERVNIKFLQFDHRCSMVSSWLLTNKNKKMVWFAGHYLNTGQSKFQTHVLNINRFDAIQFRYLDNESII